MSQLEHLSSDLELESDSEEVSVGEKSSKMDSFVVVISKYKVLFDKSQTPEKMALKEKAIKDCIDELKKKCAETYSKKILMKKLSRIKNDVKVKSDKNRTGNKKVVLKSWEKIILDVIGENGNPTIHKVPGAKEVGVSSSSIASTSGSSSSSVRVQDQEITVPPRPQKKKISAVDEMETDETRKLSIQELQRLVLLEQLSYYRLKKQNIEN